MNGDGGPLERMLGRGEYGVLGGRAEKAQPELLSCTCPKKFSGVRTGGCHIHSLM
jgi:hypothetical protein